MPEEIAAHPAGTEYEVHPSFCGNREAVLAEKLEKLEELLKEAAQVSVALGRARHGLPGYHETLW